MKLSYTEDQPRVDYDTAKARALACLRARPKRKGQYIPLPAAWVAHAIWPKHQMHAQGAGGAASRILKRMEREGLVYWTTHGGNWGWVVQQTRKLRLP